MIHRIDPIHAVLLLVVLTAIGGLGLVSQSIDETTFLTARKETINAAPCKKALPLEAQSFEERSGKDFLPPLCW